MLTLKAPQALYRLTFFPGLKTDLAKRFVLKIYSYEVNYIPIHSLDTGKLSKRVYLRGVTKHECILAIKLT